MRGTKAPACEYIYSRDISYYYSRQTEFMAPPASMAVLRLLGSEETSAHTYDSIPNTYTKSYPSPKGLYLCKEIVISLAATVASKSMYNFHANRPRIKAGNDC